MNQTPSWKTKTVPETSSQLAPILPYAYGRVETARTWRCYRMEARRKLWTGNVLDSRISAAVLSSRHVSGVTRPSVVSTGAQTVSWYLDQGHWRKDRSGVAYTVAEADQWTLTCFFFQARQQPRARRRIRRSRGASGKGASKQIATLQLYLLS